MAKGGGGGGSQLAQLKARMHSDGITDRRQMKSAAKKRKRGQAASERDEQLARREKLAKIASSAQFNPFEEKVTKPKAIVLGQKVRGATGKPGVARQGGQRERMERLLPEWQNRNKSGSFVDRRFGEGDSGSMSVDDKMLERFTRERQRKASKSELFNLNDAEEEGLTHYGRSLNDLDTYDDIHLSDEEMDEDRMAHFGGFDEEEGSANEGDGEERQKSKAEVMKELIAKSKMHKQERQQSKMADEQLRQQLDEGFGDLRQLLFVPGAISEKDDEDGGKTNAEDDGKKAKEAAYDAAVREMIFERRAKPQDRLKTAEEKAQELAERLREAEEDRQRRMRGEEVERKANGKGARNVGGDDLEDDFELDGVTSADVYGLGQGLQTAQSHAEENVDVEEAEDDGDNESEDEGLESGEDQDSDDAEEEDDFDDLADASAAAEQLEDEGITHEGEQESIVAKSKKTSKQLPSGSLPFTYPCPSTLDELLQILGANHVAPSDVPTVIKRIRALHHTSFAEDNKVKLQALLGVLVDYTLHLAVGINAKTRSDTMFIINALVPQLFSLSRAYPIAASKHFVGKLAVMQRNLARGLANGATDLAAKTWPGVAECIFLKISGTIWPTSDRSHPVTTPLALLVGQYLSSCRVRSVKDAATLLFLVSLVADNERDSKRLVPEALNALHNAICMLAPIRSKQVLTDVNQTFGIPWPDVGQPHARKVRLSDGSDLDRNTEPVDLLGILTQDSDADEDSKVHLLSASFTIIETFTKLYCESAAFVELFQPFEMLLVDVIKPFTPSSWLEKQRKKTQEAITRSVINAQKGRRALRLQAHRAIPLASHIPKFDQGFNPERKGGRTFDPDTERAELAKLRALAKKERKGAMRELRRDNEFLADARREAREQEDKRYAKTIDKIMGSLSAERGEEKAYLRDKQKLKRRSGKK